MGCNAWNHHNCNCGWGGNTGSYSKQSAHLGVNLREVYKENYFVRFVSSSTVPTSCPVCKKKPVFFYSNSNGSRVFFDDLGPPWPKHPCTDNTNARSAKTFSKHDDIKEPPFNWKKEGWAPIIFCATKILNKEKEEVIVGFKADDNQGKIIKMTVDRNLIFPDTSIIFGRKQKNSYVWDLYIFDKETLESKESQGIETKIPKIKIDASTQRKSRIKKLF